MTSLENRSRRPIRVLENSNSVRKINCSVKYRGGTKNNVKRSTTQESGITENRRIDVNVKEVNETKHVTKICTGISDENSEARGTGITFLYTRESEARSYLNETPKFYSFPEATSFDSSSVSKDIIKDRNTLKIISSESNTEVKTVPKKDRRLNQIGETENRLKNCKAKSLCPNTDERKYATYSSVRLIPLSSYFCMRLILIIHLLQWMTVEGVTATSLPIPCPLQCICLSQAQVLCNTGGLTDIPVSALPATVEHLSLTKNNFPLIRSDAFNGLRNLRKLSLDGNNISVIKPFAFRGLPRLRELSIQHTPISVITQFAFAALQNITAILLGHNKIHKIEGYAFAGTSNVRLLLLNSNPLHKIETSAFSGLTNVEHLILPSGIKNIEPDAFSGLDSVGLIKLSFMDLTALKAHTFRGLTHVHVLSVQESDLGVIKPNAFAGMAHVNSLNLLNNKIDSIQEFHILQEAKVKILRLHGNHLLENPLPGAIVLEGVETLNVTSNHFPCDCHLHVLIDGPLANGSATEFSAKNFCISPFYYNGKSISAVNMKTIGRCSEDLTRDTWDAPPSGSNICQISLYIILSILLLFITR